MVPLLEVPDQDRHDDREPLFSAHLQIVVRFLQGHVIEQPPGCIGQVEEGRPIFSDQVTTIVADVHFSPLSRCKAITGTIHRPQWTEVSSHKVGGCGWSPPDAPSGA